MFDSDRRGWIAVFVAMLDQRDLTVVAVRKDSIVEFAFVLGQRGLSFGLGLVIDRTDLNFDFFAAEAE